MARATRSAAIVIVLFGAMSSITSGAEQRGGQDRRTSAATVPLAGWNDLEVWSRDAANGSDMEIGIGFQFTGPKGQVGASFEVTRPRSAAANAPAKEVVMTVIPQYDPTRVRFREAWFVVTNVDAKGGKHDQKLDFSSKVIAYPPGPYAPGDGPVSAKVSLKPEEFVALAAADSAVGNLINVGFNVRPEQLKALRAFAQRAGVAGGR